MDSDRFNSLVDQLRSKQKKSGFVLQKSHLPGHFARINTFSIRRKLRMTIAEFEDIFGVSEFMVREWEKGVIKPEKPILLLLHIADKWPEIFSRALKEY